MRERRGSRPLAMAMARLCRGVIFSRRRRLEFVFLDRRGLSRGFACTSGFSYDDDDDGDDEEVESFDGDFMNKNEGAGILLLVAVIAELVVIR